MKNYKILVLLKPNTDLQPAMERASDCARFMPEIEVTACRIINEFDDAAKQSLESSAKRELAAVAKSHPNIKNFIPKVIFSKDVPGAFIKEAHDGEYHLAIISANRRNTIKDLFISPIDSAIMRKIDVPLLVVKHTHATQVLGRVILLAIDFEEANHEKDMDEVLYYAARVFADEFNGELHVVNCVSPRHRGRSSGASSASTPPVFRHSLGELTRKDVHHLLLNEYAEKHDIPEEHTHVLIGRVDEEIPRLCNILNVRMVCMGASKRDGLLASMNSNAGELVLEQIRGDLFLVNDATHAAISDMLRKERLAHES